MPMGGPLIPEGVMPAAMLAGFRLPPMDAGPLGPGWFMNWLLYAWVGPIWKEEQTGPYWFISLFCVSCKAATVAVAVAVAVAAAAATAAAAAAAAGCVKSAGGLVCGGMPMPAGALGPPG